MAESSHGTGGLTFDRSKRVWPNEINIFIALILIVAVFEALGQLLPYMNNQSLLFDTKDRFDSIFNEARLQIIDVLAQNGEPVEFGQPLFLVAV